MKKQLNLTGALLGIILLSVVVYLAGCSKSGTTSAIVGTWGPSKAESITKLNGATIKDTTFAITPATIGITSFTFSSNGQYSEILYPGGADSTGNYTYTNGILTFTSGKNQGSGQAASVSGSTLTITGGIDTTSVSPLSTQQSIYTLNKQ